MQIENFKIIGLLLHKQKYDIVKFQELLSSYGNIIRSRLGVSDPVDDESVQGLIILEVYGENKEINNFLEDIKAIEGIQIKQMDF